MYTKENLIKKIRALSESDFINLHNATYSTYFDNESYIFYNLKECAELEFLPCEPCDVLRMVENICASGAPFDINKTPVQFNYNGLEPWGKFRNCVEIAEIMLKNLDNDEIAELLG